MRPRKPVPNARQAVSYRRVSTAEQGTSGAGLDAQAVAITAACAARGLTVVSDFHDVASGAKKANRPGLADALAAVGPGGAGVLVVAKQDRLTRSMFDLAGLVKQAETEGWALVIADTGLDTSTPAGKMQAHVLGALAEWERDLIGQRTAEALAVRKAQGVKLGRPSTVAPKVRRRILALRAKGMSWKAITETLDAENAPTGQGGRWHPTQVRRLWLAEQAA